MSAVLTDAELAERWSVHVTTVQKLCRQGKVRAFKVGDLWRIPESAVEEYEQAS